MKSYHPGSPRAGTQAVPTWPGIAQLGPVGTHARLTPRPPSPMAPVCPEVGQHNLPVPTPLLWPQGTPGWVGFSAPLLLGR